jgi:hypothetical protein
MSPMLIVQLLKRRVKSVNAESCRAGGRSNNNRESVTKYCTGGASTAGYRGIPPTLSFNGWNRPLITVWLQVRVLPGRPRFALLFIGSQQN